MPHRHLITPLLLLLACTLGSAPSHADDPMSYQRPPDNLAQLVQQPFPPNSRLDPQKRFLILEHRPSLTTIAELSEEELRLAGMRIKPAHHGPSRERYIERLEIIPLAGGEPFDVTGLPDEARLGWLSWSPDGSHLAFTNTRETGIELWVAEIETGRAKRLSDPVLNMVADIPPRWMRDGQHLIVPTVPPNHPTMPKKPRVPTGPVVQENLGQVSPNRTFQDLLQNAHDESLFEYFMTGQLVRIGLDGTSKPLGSPGLYWNITPSPDGQYLLVETIKRPFSYLVPVWRFAKAIEVWTVDGTPVKLVHDRPLQESIPIAFGSVEVGPRQVRWRNDKPASLAWAEAQDGGDAGQDAEIRDRLFTLDAPFDGEPTTLASLPLRYGGTEWASDDLAMVTTYWWKTRQLQVWRLRPAKPDTPPNLVFDYSFEDRYNNPGNPVTHSNEYGRQVLYTTEDGRLLLRGEGASPEGDRPFLDLLDLETGETERLFHSQAPYYEIPINLVSASPKKVLVRRESVEEPPNFFLKTLEDGKLHQLTHRAHPTPSLVGLQKELLRYERKDGIPLTATLYLPPDHDLERDGPLPTLLWAYPQEFKSAEAAGQVTTSPYRFDTIGWYSPLIWLAEGYAVLDDPAMPIVGEGDEEPNDTFIEQLVSSAEAAVGELVRRGVSRKDQIAVGGHSYGAFMTAHLLAHTDLFIAGIARSGAYNRTLTPFGFQSEERNFWEAPELYFTMSPFTHAAKINEPILLIHGSADNNSGTFPMQSERLYNALKGLGATARLVMLPEEGHGYRAEESILHMLWESHRWLENYVGNGHHPEEPPKVMEDTQPQG